MGKFLKNASGNAAMLFAAAAVPLILAAGMGVDMVRANHVQTVLQGAADAAALAGAVSGETGEAALQDIVVKYAESNGVSNALESIASITPKLDKKNRTFSVTIKGKMDTSLMRLANISNMDVGAYAEVAMGGNALELVLVLDTTGSMGASGRMAALKDAAEDMVKDLMKLEKQGVDIKIGIVPFGDYVKVGMANRNKSWMSVPADSTSTGKYCYNTYPDARNIGNCRMSDSWTSYDDGIPTIHPPAEICDWDYGAPVEVCSDSTHEIKWHGCAGSRDNPLDEIISDLSVRYPGVMDKTCGAPITTLTDDEGDLEDAINALVPVGNTYIPSGLVWGWNIITSSEPFAEAKTAAEMTALGGTKAIVLMTDGANTLSASYPYHGGNDVAEANLKTAALCDNIKADNITMFTVSFMVDSAPAQDILDACASDSEKSYSAESAEQLTKAFRDIGDSLAAVRLSK
jgi:Flp pilus assembly protein TadG